MELNRLLFIPVILGTVRKGRMKWDAEQGNKKFTIRHPANADKELGLNPDLPICRETPPTFLLQAEDA